MQNFLLEHPEATSQLTEKELIETISACRALEVSALARLFAGDHQRAAGTQMSTNGDRLLDVTAASELLSVTKQWLYRNGRNLKLVVELGPGTVRYSQAAILAFVRKSAANAHAR